MGIRPQQIEAGENNTTCSWRDSNGFSPPNNELCNLLHPPPEKGLHMAWTVPGGLEKDELLLQTRDTSAPGVKIQQLVWSRLVSQWHGPSQPFHTKIRITVLFSLNNSHTLGNRVFQPSWDTGGLHRPEDTMFIHPFIQGWGLDLFSNQALGLNSFVKARLAGP